MKVKDVVCGMEIEAESAAGKSEYQGRTYYFCGLGCKAAFDKEPARYAAAAGHDGGSEGHHHHHH